MLSAAGSTYIAKATINTNDDSKGSLEFINILYDNSVDMLSADACLPNMDIIKFYKDNYFDDEEEEDFIEANGQDYPHHFIILKEYDSEPSHLTTPSTGQQ